METPSVKPSVCQLPLRGSLLVRFTSSHIKPALKGEVDMSVSEWTEGLHRSCCCLRQPLSRLRRQLPGRGAFWAAQTKSCPHEMGKVAANAMSRRRGCSEAAVVCANPSVGFADSSPAGEPLVRFTSSHVKLALKGEVDASVTSRRRGCIEAVVVYVNPSVTAYAVPAPRPGSLWCALQALTLSLP